MGSPRRATKEEKGEDEDQEFNNLSLSLSLLRSGAGHVGRGSPSLFGRCRGTAAMKRDIFSRQKCHRGRSSSGDLTQFVFSEKLVISHSKFPTRRVGAVRFSQDDILTLVTCDNLCPHDGGGGAAAAPSTTYCTYYIATPQDEGKYRARRRGNGI